MATSTPSSPSSRATCSPSSDNEAELLRILAAEARNRPQLLARAVEQLFSASFDGFTGWIADKTDPALPPERARAIGAVGLGALYSSRLLGSVLGVQAPVDDEQFVGARVQMLVCAMAAEGGADGSA